jgi:hypothetical protein
MVTFCSLAHRVKSGRIAEDLHRQDRPGAARDGGLDPPGVDVQARRIDIDKDRPGPGHHDRGRGGNERERRRDDLVPRPDTQGQQAQEQAAGAAVDRHGVRAADICRESVLEAAQSRSQRQVRAAQHLHHLFDFPLGDIRSG